MLRSCILYLAASSHSSVRDPPLQPLSTDWSIVLSANVLTGRNGSECPEPFIRTWNLALWDVWRCVHAHLQPQLRRHAQAAICISLSSRNMSPLRLDCRTSNADKRCIKSWVGNNGRLHLHERERSPALSISQKNCRQHGSCACLRWRVE